MSATLEGDSLVTALGVESADPAPSARRADALIAPRLPRRRGRAEADLVSVAAPGDTAVFFCRTQTTPSWLDDFLPLASADRPAAQRAEEGEIPGALIIERNVLEWRLDPARPPPDPRGPGPRPTDPDPVLGVVHLQPGRRHAPGPGPAPGN